MSGYLRNFFLRTVIAGLFGVAVPAHMLFAGFTVTVEPEGGLKTNVASSRSDPLETSAFFSACLTPSWSFDSTRVSLYVLSSAAEVSRYANGTGEFKLEPRIAAIKNADSHTTTLCLGVSYFSIATEYDPTLPQEFTEYTFLFDRKSLRENPLTLSYAFSIVDDAASSRFDIKNSIKLKFTGKAGPHARLFAKPGIMWNLSNSDTGNFLQPLISIGATYFPDTKDLLAFQIYAGFPIYERTGFFPPKHKNNNTWIPAGPGSIPQPRIPISMIFLSYCREITASLDFLCNYDFTAFDPGGLASLYTSHRISAGLEWRLF